MSGRRRVSDFVTHQGFRFVAERFTDRWCWWRPITRPAASSRALDRDGKIVWSRAGPSSRITLRRWCSTVAGRDQLLLVGLRSHVELRSAHRQAAVGSRNSTTECVGTQSSPTGSSSFASGGYPKKLTVAVGETARTRSPGKTPRSRTCPSMIAHKGYLYTVTDAGIVYCWKAATGEEQWKTRLGGTFNASPVLVGELLFATDQEGKTTIFKASPTGFESVGENRLGEDVYATPVFVDGQVFMRVAQGSGETRQEWLYCIGKKKS